MADVTLRMARAAFFQAEGLPADGGYAKEWVQIKIGPFPFRYRNTEGRKRLAPAHDLHHILTGYSTSLLGEAEIAAWEIGSGLRDATGLWLSFRVLGFMVLLAPRRTFAAFVRGRSSRNLFDAAAKVDELLDRPEGEVRGELALSRTPHGATAADVFRFAGWSLAGFATVFGPIFPAAALLWYWLG